jgi:hypothetical protein
VDAVKIVLAGICNYVVGEVSCFHFTNWNFWPLERTSIRGEREKEKRRGGGFLVIYESTLYVGGRGTFLFMFIELKRRVL